ncbi:hypothetical protein N9131_00640, partial [bacterium]|nr:hypothetical protein [bacterium]
MIPFGKTLFIPLAFAAPLVLKGAEITWQAPFNITSVDSIDTNGTLVDAVNATSGGDSPTVNVGGENITFTAE